MESAAIMSAAQMHNYKEFEDVPRATERFISDFEKFIARLENVNNVLHHVRSHLFGPFPSKGREDLEKDAVEGQFDKMQLRLQLAYQLIDAIEEHAQTLDRCA